MEKIINLIQNNHSFALFCHIDPDADALGSMNALRIVLKNMGKKVSIFCDGEVPRKISFLKIRLEKDERKIEAADVCIMMDCNSLDRIGRYGELFDRAKVRAIIDHHQRDNYSFDVECVDTSSPSTCDLLYEIFKVMNVKIDRVLALNLYAGLSSDTGCFMHPNTTQKSHQHASELIAHKFDLEDANYNMFKFKPRNYLRFLKTALSKTRQYLNGKVLLTFFDLQNYKKFSKICYESILFQIFDGIEDNEIRVRIIEEDNGVFSLSFRSNKYVNACNIAKKFGGGGHIRAAGATYRGEIQSVIAEILHECKEELEK